MTDRQFVIGEYEAVVDDLPSAKRLAAYASAWWDLRTTDSILHERDQIPDDAGHLFVRRAMWDAAVVTYARCFNSSRRKAADLGSLVKAFRADELATHKAALAWRNHHAAHRVDETLETAETFLVWPNFGKAAPFARVRIHTRVDPESPGPTDGLRSVAKSLADSVWHEYLWPLQDLLLKEDAATVSLKGKATPYHKPKQPKGILGVELTIAEKPSF